MGTDQLKELKRLQKDRNTVTMSGPMTSCIIGRMRAGLLRTHNIIDEYSRECLAIRVKRKLNATDVTDALTDLFILRGIGLHPLG